MKKLLVLFPLFLFFIGCVESELYVDGENVGSVGGDGDTPTHEIILKQFDYVTPIYSYQYLFNPQGKITNVNLSMSLLGETVTSNGVVSYQNNLISTLTPGNFSAQDNLIYNDQNQLIEINTGTTPETKMVFTHTGTTITGVRTLDGVLDNTVTFTKDNAGYITGYSFTDASNNKQYSLSLNVANNLLSSSTFKENTTVLQQMNFTYDNKINPLFLQSIDYFNIMVMMDAYGFESDFIALPLDTYAMYRSSNNITQLTASGSGSAYIEGTINYVYTYNEADFPVSAVLNIEGEEPGVVHYTYY
ncbi:MAG: hypothetical protein Q4G27_07380 [Flavobacteriaceae bacterium]|nr:hypothetical protein [Flavobacteriaceae bacterium]